MNKLFRILHIFKLPRVVKIWRVFKHMEGEEVAEKMGEEKQEVVAVGQGGVGKQVPTVTHCMTSLDMSSEKG